MKRTRTVDVLIDAMTARFAPLGFTARRGGKSMERTVELGKVLVGLQKAKYLPIWDIEMGLRIRKDDRHYNSPLVGYFDEDYCSALRFTGEESAPDRRYFRVDQGWSDPAVALYGRAVIDRSLDGVESCYRKYADPVALREWLLEEPRPIGLELRKQLDSRGLKFPAGFPWHNEDP